MASPASDGPVDRELTGSAVLNTVAWFGWGLVPLITFMISHFHLFGLSQGFARLLRRPARS